MLDSRAPLALYMEGASNQDFGKMGFGLLRYSANPITCVIDSASEYRDMAETGRTAKSVPIVPSVAEAIRLGASVLVLGIAPAGGLIPPEWWPDVDLAVANGLSVVNGLHDLVAPRYPVRQPGQWIWDIRVEPAGLTNGIGLAAKLQMPRLLTIGTDMAVGKMTAGLELMRAARESGIATEFVATGQIGVAITGHGVPLDAVRVDFASGSIEREVVSAATRLDSSAPGTRPPAPGRCLIIIEGQGAIIHPSSTATLPLLRGSCPTHLLLCHRAGQTSLRRLPEIRIPPLRAYAKLYEDLAEALGAFPLPKTIGVALNTSHLGHSEADRACWEITDETGWPCVDPVRHGCRALVDAARVG